MKIFNVLYLHNTAYLAGAEKSLLFLATNLDKEKFNPIFACPSYDQFGEELRSNNIDIENIEFPSIRKIIGVKNTLNKLMKIVKKHNVDLIHANDLRTDLYASFIGMICHISVIWHARNLITKEMFDYEKYSSFLPDAIFCNGSVIAHRFSFRNKLFKKVKIIYTGVDISIYNTCISKNEIRREFNIKDDEIVFGIIGRIGRGKGHKYFIEAAFNILKTYQKIKFLIVGESLFQKDKQIEEDARLLVNKLNIQNEVIFTNFRKDIPQIMNALDVFVLASEAEPFGRSLLEAMACGKPIIATNSGGTPEIVLNGETGILVPSGNSEALTRAMEIFIKDKDLRLKIGNLARKRAEEVFDIKKCIRLLEEEYIKLLAK